MWGNTVKAFVSLPTYLVVSFLYDRHPNHHHKLQTENIIIPCYFLLYVHAYMSQ